MRRLTLRAHRNTDKAMKAKAAICTDGKAVKAKAAKAADNAPAIIDKPDGHDRISDAWTAADAPVTIASRHPCGIDRGKIFPHSSF